MRDSLVSAMIQCSKLEKGTRVKLHHPWWSKQDNTKNVIFLHQISFLIHYSCMKNFVIFAYVIFNLK